MATPETYVIPGVGAHNDTDQGSGIVIPGVGVVNEGEAAGGAVPSPRTNIQGPLVGPMGGPV